MCCLGYAIFQFKQLDAALEEIGSQDIIWELQKIIIANPIVIGVCQLAYFYLGARVCLEFG